MGYALREDLLVFIDKATIILENNKPHEQFTEKNRIDALIKEKNLSAVILDIKSNKNNWLVKNVEKNMNNQTAESRAYTIGCFKLLC